jgi:hypothetical protein
MRLPSLQDRTLILGRTGSGKTQCGLFVLSRMDLETQPWIIIDFKREKSIAQIPHLQEIRLEDELPEMPGLYVLRPIFPAQKEQVTEFLYRVWDHENIGIFVDEGVMLARDPALDAIYIQGRSKNIPVIMLSQRPVGISRFAATESQFYAIFPNHDEREQKVISEFTPLFKRKSDDASLPRFWFWWYDVVENKLSKVKPVPAMEKTLAVFEDILAPEVPEELGESESEDSRSKKRFAVL